MRPRLRRVAVALFALVKIVWWFVVAVVALPLLPLYWLARMLKGKAIIHDLPADVVPVAMMDRLKPEIAKENQAAFRLWWRSAMYHRLVIEYGVTSEAAHEAASEAAAQVECTVRRV